MYLVPPSELSIRNLEDQTKSVSHVVSDFSSWLTSVQHNVVPRCVIWLKVWCFCFVRYSVLDRIINRVITSFLSAESSLVILHWPFLLFLPDASVFWGVIIFSVCYFNHTNLFVTLKNYKHGTLSFYITFFILRVTKSFYPISVWGIEKVVTNFGH